MVSPNDHVVMNHQNQTRINGIRGHIRYSEQALYILQHSEDCVLASNCIEDLR
jgi:hypothetical protein